MSDFINHVLGTIIMRLLLFGIVIIVLPICMFKKSSNGDICYHLQKMGVTVSSILSLV